MYTILQTFGCCIMHLYHLFGYLSCGRIITLDGVNNIGLIFVICSLSWHCTVVSLKDFCFFAFSCFFHYLLRKRPPKYYFVCRNLELGWWPHFYRTYSRRCYMVFVSQSIWQWPYPLISNIFNDLYSTIYSDTKSYYNQTETVNWIQVQTFTIYITVVKNSWEPTNLTEADSDSRVRKRCCKLQEQGEGGSHSLASSLESWVFTL